MRYHTPLGTRDKSLCSRAFTNEYHIVYNTVLEPIVLGSLVSKSTISRGVAGLKEVLYVLIVSP